MTLTRDARAALVLAALSITLGAVFFNPFMGGWDSVVYMTSILDHRPSPLMLGRPYFIAYNVALWEAASLLGVAAEHAFQVVKCGVVVLSGAASAFLFLFVRRLVSFRAAIWATLFLACSPVVAQLSGAIMTEMPMLAALFAGLWLHQRGLEERRTALLVGGCALIGLAAGVREQAVFIGPYLIAAAILARAPWRAVALGWTAGAAVFLAGPVALWLFDPSYRNALAEWSRHMANSRERYPTTAWDNLPVWFAWIKATLPVAALLSPWGMVILGRFRERYRFALAYVSVCVVELLLLIGYQDLLYGPRFLLIAMPGLALAAGVAVERLRTRVSLRPVAVGFVLLQATALGYGYWVAFLQGYGRSHELAREYRERLETAPSRSVFVAGHLSPYLHYYRRIGAARSCEPIEAGWEWPGPELHRAIDRRLEAGIPVYVDEAPALWAGERTQQEFADWQAIRDRYELEEIDATLLRIEGVRDR
jgi:hypothetical protein